MNDPKSSETVPSFSRRLFLKRAGQACGILVILPAVKQLQGGLFASTLSNGDTRYFEHTIVAMGTTARLGVYAASEEEANSVINAAFGELKKLEALFSGFVATSDVSRLNAAAGGAAVAVAPETLEILSASIDYSKLTHRAFDITVEPLMKLWGFRSDAKDLRALPTPKDVNEALQYIGADQIEIDRAHTTARLHGHGTRIDLGGIAVGYALDRMGDVLRQRGIERAFIDISGDVLALGSPDEKGWPIAIPDPQNLSRIIYHTNIRDEALATSGSYMSYVVYNAIKYGHIMDPHDGRPATRVLSSTVITKRGIDADALSTASFVTGQRYGATKLIVVDSLGKVEEA
jgi:thiamine biosynthesis lipoprotein